MVLLVYSYSKEVGVRDMLQEFNDLCGWASRLTRLQWQKRDSSRGALPTWVMWECMAGFLQYRGSAPFFKYLRSANSRATPVSLQPWVAMSAVVLCALEPGEMGPRGGEVQPYRMVTRGQHQAEIGIGVSLP